jgi:TRAP-type C4-dicarboxylate transport system permease large subunit
MYEQRGSSVSLPLLIVLILWLSIIFISFGLFAPRNATVVASLFAAALSVFRRGLLNSGDVHPLRGPYSNL